MKSLERKIAQKFKESQQISGYNRFLMKIIRLQPSSLISSVEYNLQFYKKNLINFQFFIISQTMEYNELVNQYDFDQISIKEKFCYNPYGFFNQKCRNCSTHAPLNYLKLNRFTKLVSLNFTLSYVGMSEILAHDLINEVSQLSQLESLQLDLSYNFICFNNIQEAFNSLSQIEKLKDLDLNFELNKLNKNVKLNQKGSIFKNFQLLRNLRLEMGGFFEDDQQLKDFLIDFQDLSLLQTLRLNLYHYAMSRRYGKEIEFAFSHLQELTQMSLQLIYNNKIGVNSICRVLSRNYQNLIELQLINHKNDTQWMETLYLTNYGISQLVNLKTLIFQFQIEVNYWLFPRKKGSFQFVVEKLLKLICRLKNLEFLELNIEWNYYIHYAHRQRAFEKFIKILNRSQKLVKLVFNFSDNMQIVQGDLAVGMVQTKQFNINDQFVLLKQNKLSEAVRVNQLFRTPSQLFNKNQQVAF